LLVRVLVVTLISVSQLLVDSSKFQLISRFDSDVSESMIGENRQLVTDEPVEFEK
jgi:hypothetical protein